MHYYSSRPVYPNELCHHGIKGQKWGIRNYQNSDGSLTEAGKKRYYTSSGHLTYNRKLRREFVKGSYKDYKKTTDDAYKEGYKTFKKDSKNIVKSYRAAKKGASKEKKRQLKEKLIKDLLKVETAYNKTVNSTRESLEKKYGKAGIDFLHKRRIRNKYIARQVTLAFLGALADQHSERRHPSMNDSDRLRRENRQHSTSRMLELNRAPQLVGGTYDQRPKYIRALTKYSRKYRKYNP